MATGTSLFTYGVPTTEYGRLASIRRSLSRHTAAFASFSPPRSPDCSESLYRQTDSGEVCQWSVERGGGPADAAGDEVYLDLYVLEQHIDGDAIRTQLANPYASYSPNTINVRAAIKAVADAAATMHVSNLVKQYNSRAERVFKATIAHMNSKNTKEFQALFYPMSIKGGGFVLLQPELSAVADSYFEKCEFPVQRSGVGKRIRLACSIEDPDDGLLHSCAMFPALGTWHTALRSPRLRSRLCPFAASFARIFVRLTSSLASFRRHHPGAASVAAVPGEPAGDCAPHAVHRGDSGRQGRFSQDPHLVPDVPCDCGLHPAGRWCQVGRVHRQCISERSGVAAQLSLPPGAR